MITGIFPLGRAHAQIWNNPHAKAGAENVVYLPFANAPKTLDPARSYSTDEVQFTAQIYEPPLQYNYLKRPYTLEPLSAAAMPTITFYNAEGKKLADNPNPSEVAYTLYDIAIQPGIFYQPHPAFAKDAKGKFFYHDLNRHSLKNIYTLADFNYNGARELTADDFVYAIKRLASPNVQSPIYGLMSQYIVGLADLAKQLQGKHGYIDLRQYPLSGVKVIDPYHYQIKVKGFYPQFIYWLAMPFFAPIPWEAVYFYSQQGMAEKNITLDWYPVGTGPYMLTENNPNQRMVLSRNPNFHDEFYPDQGEVTDADKGLLKNAGKKLPFIDEYIFTLDKESIPRWNKFIQGYYDWSGVSSDSFDQAIHLDKDGQASLTHGLQNKGVTLSTSVEPAMFYIGFNMLDPVVGGYTEQQQKLRQAISIALNQEEFISIFLNGRGVPAQGPLPPGIFGYQAGEAGINPWVYLWQNNRPERQSLADAKSLLAAAGYPNGKDAKTGKPLLLNLDVPSTAGPDDNAQYNWYRKQFAQLGIELNIRATLYNRFQDKVRSGAVQMFNWGWTADYPDPENFLFLLYGPNGKVKFGGENAANYFNSQADQLFTEIADLPDGNLRQQKITEFLKIVQKDSPWVWGFNPSTFILLQPWISSYKPNAMANNTLKYLSLDGAMRAKLRHRWNPPLTWPLWMLFALVVALVLPLVITYWLRERRSGIKRY